MDVDESLSAVDVLVDSAASRMAVHRPSSMAVAVAVAVAVAGGAAVVVSGMECVLAVAVASMMLVAVVVAFVKSNKLEPSPDDARGRAGGSGSLVLRQGA